MLSRVGNRRGEISILLVIMVLISLVFIAGYFNMVKKSYAIDEIQSSLDIAGVASLERVVDHEFLKDEILAIDKNNKIDIVASTQNLSDYENQIKSEYRKLVSFNEDIIPTFNIVNQKVYFEQSSWGIGGTTAQKPQIVMETVMNIKLEISRGHDYSRILDAKFYSSKQNKSFDIISIGSSADGLTELTIRSTVRSVYN